MELQQVHIERKDYSISELAGMLRDGDIKTDPDYQRGYIYDDKKASSLVESILMGIPIPILYLSEENDYTYEVIDGQQRIISFVRYYNNEFRLKLNEQSSLFELNGKKFKELDKIVQNKYKKCSLSAIVILEDSKELKYDSVMVSFSYFRKQDIMNNSDKIRDKIMEIKKIDDSYDKCIRMGTSVGSKLHTRIEIMYNAIKEIIERNPLNIYDTRCFTEEQKKSLFFDGCKCGICGQTLLNIDDCEVDHIVPYSKGGRTILENAQLVHSYCNKSKGNREY